jgi:hypothetical protein
MNTLKVRAISGVMFLTLLIGFSTARAQEKSADAPAPDELKKLHVLLVVDVDSNLRESVIRDMKNTKKALEAIVRDATRLNIVKLDGDGDAALPPIQAALEKMKITPQDAVLFMYFGHGQFDVTANEHLFTTQSGYRFEKKPVEIKRSDVVKSIQKYNPGLLVMLSDCCSSLKVVPTKREVKGIPEVETLSPSPIVPRRLAQSLFFKARGFVNITAAQKGEPAWSDQNGGFFTGAMTKTMFLQVQNEMTWEAFFADVQRQTQNRFETTQRQIRNRGTTVRDDGERDLLQAKPQQPWKMEIKVRKPTTAEVATSKSKSPEAKSKNEPNFGAILIINKTKEDATFTYRLPGGDEDKTSVVKPGDKFFEVFEVAAEETEAKIKLGIKTESRSMPMKDVPVMIYKDGKPDEGKVKAKVLMPVKS